MISFVCSWFRKSFLVFPKNCHKLPNYSNRNVKCKLFEIKMVNVFDYWHTFAMSRLIFFSPLRSFVNSVVENGKAYASARRWHRPFSSWKRKVHFWKTMHSKKVNIKGAKILFRTNTRNKNEGSGRRLTLTAARRLYSLQRLFCAIEQCQMTIVSPRKR